MRTVLITGGNGYLGAVLVRHLLASGVAVHATANRNRDRLEGLLPPENIHAVAGRDAASLVERLQPDSIFHLASVHPAPADEHALQAMFDGNLVLGTSLLMGASMCDKPPVFINAGTFWQFSNQSHYSPNSLYAATKQSFHDVLLYYRARRHVPALTLILYDIYGSDDHRPKLWRMLFDAAPGATVPLSHGTQLVELVHVDDAARAFLHAAELLRLDDAVEAMYAVRSGERVSLRQIIESSGLPAKLGIQLEWGSIPYRKEQIFDPWQGPMLPGWLPQKRFEQVVDEVLLSRQRKEPL